MERNQDFEFLTIWLILFLKKWANPGLFLFNFVLFSLQFQYKLKKHRWCAWNSNLGPQDGRHRQNQGAMAATLAYSLLLLREQISYKSFRIDEKLYSEIMHSNWLTNGTLTCNKMLYFRIWSYCTLKFSYETIF